MNKFVIFPIVFLQGALACHFSCAACVGDLSSSCTACFQGKQLLLLNQQLHSGACLEYAPSVQLNILGVVLLAVPFLLLALTKSRELTVYLSNLQDISLLGLLPLSQSPLQAYLCDSLQYSLLDLKIASLVLPRANEPILLDGRLSLSNLVGSVQMISLIEITLLASLALLVIALVVLTVGWVKKQCSSGPVDRYMVNRLGDFWTVVQFLVFLTVVEHMMSMTIAVRWWDSQQSASKGIFCLSVLIVVGLWIVTLWRPLPMFVNRKLNAAVLLRKCLIGVLVCVSISPMVPSLVLVLLLSGETIYEIRLEKYRQLRYFIYKLHLIVLCIEHAIQVRVDVIDPQLEHSRNTSIAIAATLIAFMLVPLVELGFYLYDKCVAKPPQNMHSTIAGLAVGEVHTKFEEKNETELPAVYQFSAECDNALNCPTMGLQLPPVLKEGQFILKDVTQSAFTELPPHSSIQLNDIVKRRRPINRRPTNCIEIGIQLREETNEGDCVNG